MVKCEHCDKELICANCNTPLLYSYWIVITTKDGNELTFDSPDEFFDWFEDNWFDVIDVKREWY